MKTKIIYYQNFVYIPWIHSISNFIRFSKCFKRFLQSKLSFKLLSVNFSINFVIFQPTKSIKTSVNASPCISSPSTLIFPIHEIFLTTPKIRYFLSRLHTFSSTSKTPFRKLINKRRQETWPNNKRRSAFTLSSLTLSGCNWKHYLIVTPFTYITNLSTEKSKKLLSFSRLSDGQLSRHPLTFIVDDTKKQRDTDKFAMSFSSPLVLHYNAYNWHILSMIADQSEEVRRHKTNKISVLV